VNSFDIVYPSAFDKDDPPGQPLIFTLSLTNGTNQEKHYKQILPVIGSKVPMDNLHGLMKQK